MPRWESDSALKDVMIEWQKLLVQNIEWQKLLVQIGQWADVWTQKNDVRLKNLILVY